MGGFVCKQTDVSSIWTHSPLDTVGVHGVVSSLEKNTGDKGYHKLILYIFCNALVYLDIGSVLFNSISI